MLLRPLRIIGEGCTEGNGAYIDKALGMWRIADIRGRLALIRNPYFNTKVIH